MKPAPIDYDTVREMLRTATPDRVLRFIGKSHPADIALLFKGLDSAEVRQLFDVLFSSRRAAKTLKELPPELLPDILALIDDEKVGRLIVRADPDDAVTFIDSLPEDRRERVLALLDPERRAAVREIINYPDGTVGRLQMTPGTAASAAGNAYTRAASEAASRAVYQCQPYRLPADRYAQWREINPLRFDPRQMMGQ